MAPVTQTRPLLMIVPRPAAIAFVHCPRCAYRAAAETKGRAFQVMTLHYAATHMPVIQDEKGAA